MGPLSLPALAKKAQNLILQSETFDSASWTKNAATVTANATAAPNGATTADKIDDNNANSPHEVSQSITKPAAPLLYTGACFVKAAQRTWVQLLLYDGTSRGVRMWYNLSTGAVGTKTDIGTGFRAVAARTEMAANGFYRCILSAETSGVGSLAFHIAPATDDAVVTYVGAAGNGIYTWGAQLNIGAQPDPYIATTTAAATRYF